MEPNTKFKNFRKSLNLNQTEFAHKLKVSQGTITDIERGRIGVSKRVKNKITEIFSIDSGYFDIEKSVKNNEINQGIESGYNQGNDIKDRYYSSLKGENKATYDTYKLIEKLSRSGLQQSEIQQLAIDEAAKLDDKSLFNYLVFAKEIINKRSDLNEIRNLILEFDTPLVDAFKIYKKYYDEILNAEIQSIDYESFKNKRIKILEELLYYKEPLNDLTNALTKFINDFKKLKEKQDTKEAK